MSDVQITSMSTKNQLLTVTGVVNGHEVAATGWTSRYINAKSPAHAKRYIEDLLVNHSENLKLPPQEVLARPKEDADLPEEVSRKMRVEHWVRTNWITVSVSVGISGIIALLEALLLRR
jgi:hypothetical protein